MKIFFLFFITILSFTLLPPSSDAFKKRTKTVVEYKSCPVAVVEDMHVDENCKNKTRVCPAAVEQNSLLHQSCQGLTKKCPSTSNTIPPGCSSITTLSDTSSSTGSTGGNSTFDLSNADCTTDANGIGTCQTEEKCTAESNIKRCTQCTQTISLTSDTTDTNATTCETDADCVLVSKGCCGCSQGGESIAIHKSQKDNHNSELQNTCLTIGYRACNQWHRCGDFQAHCNNSQCIVTDSRSGSSSTGSSSTGGSSTGSVQ